MEDARPSSNMLVGSKNLSLEEQASKLYRGEALAPMVRASTIPLRTLALCYGADFCYTEELVDRSLSESIRVENKQLGTIDYIKDVSQRSAKQQRRMMASGTANQPALVLRLDRKVEGGRLVCQMGTGEPDLAVQAALHVHRDVDAVDVNMGCPKKFSVSGGMGAALLEDPDRACRIVRSLTNTLSATRHPIPVSAKIRLLKDTQSTVDFVTGLIHAGAKAVALHGRRPGTPEVERADWENLETAVSLIKSKFPATPILVNGDFYTRDDFTNFRQKTGADGVLLARPALYNTSLFRKPSPATATEASSASSDASGAGGPHESYSYDSPLLLDKTTVVQDYLRQAVKYDANHKNIKYVICEMMNNRRHPHDRVPHLPQKCYPGGQTIAKVCDSKSLAEICRVWNVDYDAQVRSFLRGGGSGVSGEALAGEHRYLDSYLLQQQQSSSTCSATTDGASGNAAPRNALDASNPKSETEAAPSPPQKRVRVES